MRTPIAKLSVAAALAMVALLGIHFVRVTSNRVWAAVLGKVRNMDTCVYRMRTIETAGPRPDGFEFATQTETTIYRSDAYGTLDETYRNGELFTRYYRLLQQRQRIGICYPLEQYMRGPLSDAQIQEYHRKHPKQMVAGILEADYIELGEDVYEGTRTAGVELCDPGAFFDERVEMDDFTVRLWIDVSTQLPVVVQMSSVPRGCTQRTTIVADEFQWGVPLPASLFEPNIPAHFTLDTWANSHLDSTPETAPAEAFAADTQAEPYLSDFDHLTLPDLRGLVLLDTDVSVPGANVRLLSHGEIWALQDAFMAEWPSFEEVRDQLARELQDKLSIDGLNVDELVAAGIALRERFWERVGCLSPSSYPYAYAARIVTEMAHARASDDPAVTDQFVESICTSEVNGTWNEDSSLRVWNPVYSGLLTDLRLGQFARLKDRVAQGYVPTWKDYVRLHDLAILLSSDCKDYDQAASVVEWMIAQVSTAGWTYYLPSLTEMEEAYSAGQGYKTGMFMYGPDSFPEEFRYSRRVFSFQGPRERSKRLLPVHLRHLKGW